MVNARNLTVAAMITALSYVFLCAASIFPTGKLVFLCIATACLCIVVMECGRAWGAAASAVLILLVYFFLPNIGLKILFIGFFSYYPLIKSFVERGEGLLIEWIIKVTFFVLVAFIMSVLGKYYNIIPAQLTHFARSFKRIVLVYGMIVGSGCLFDFALSNIINYYGRVIMPKTNSHIVPEFESEFDDEYEEEKDEQ